jgi:hypothetical protein
MTARNSSSFKYNNNNNNNNNNKIFGKFGNMRREIIQIILLIFITVVPICSEIMQETLSGY